MRRNPIKGPLLKTELLRRSFIQKRTPKHPQMVFHIKNTPQLVFYTEKTRQRVYSTKKVPQSIFYIEMPMTHFYAEKISQKRFFTENVPKRFSYTEKKSFLYREDSSNGHTYWEYLLESILCRETLSEDLLIKEEPSVRAKSPQRRFSIEITLQMVSKTSQGSHIQSGPQGFSI